MKKTPIDMTLTEKALFMSGETTWKTKSFPAYEIPSLFLSDGPTGLRKQAGEADHLGLNESIPSTCFPTAATMANSWDVDLAYQLGTYLGDEAVEQEVDVVLGPGLNIKRNALCGRNFEYFSEDPYLSGKMAAGYIKGIQSRGAGACPKHFAANSQELRRMSNDSIVDERTLREIYLTGFEIAVKEGQPKAIMSSYNKINGIYANEDKQLLQDILKKEWGFNGFVVSDWGGSDSHVEGVRNGSHLEMPSTGKPGAYEIYQAVKNGELSEEILDERVTELLEVVEQISQEKQTAKSASTAEERHAFVRKAASESMVLLKNDLQTLPIEPTRKVAIIGDFAETPRYQGAGSSLVNPTQLETILDQVKNYPLDVVGYAKGYQRTHVIDEQLIEEAKTLSETCDTILLFMGLTEISEVEGLDRSHMRLPQNQEILLSQLAQLGKRIVVILSGGSAVEIPWIDQVSALLHGYLGGQASASAVLEVLCGQVNPSGKLNESYPLSYSDAPNYHFYPGKEKTAEYREGLFVGYRYYDTVKQDVLYPFGFGLSYTQFVLSDFTVNQKGVSCKITNQGKYAGAEVVQLYIGKKESTIYRPHKELKGFQKIFLNPGEQKEIFLSFDEYSFRTYQVDKQKWTTEKGMYQLYLGTSVNDIHFEAEIEQDGEVLEKQLISEKYWNGTIQEISKQEFETLYGRPLPQAEWDKEKLLMPNDSISQMYYAKSALARLVYKIMTNQKDKSFKKGKPDLNILFTYYMPFRAMAKMTGGMMNQEMVAGILTIVNGHLFKGTGALLKGFFHNRKINKADDFDQLERK